jgi:hypothetical protein
VPGYDKNTYATPEAAMKAENTYGQKIRNIRNKLLDVAVTDADIEKYFPKPEEPKVEPEDNIHKPEETFKAEIEITTDDAHDDNVKSVFDFLAKFIKALISFFKNFKH